jgi:hypothetical protein
MHRNASVIIPDTIDMMVRRSADLCICSLLLTASLT